MSVLKIHITYQCTAACLHCRFKCTREPAPPINLELAIKCIEDLQKSNNLKLVVLLGGEPGLFPILTFNLVAAIHKLNIEARVETNAFWSNNDKKAREFLLPLYKNKASVMFSLDSFHEPFVPLDFIERAIRITNELGGEYALEMAYLDYLKRANKEDKRTDELFQELQRRLKGHIRKPYRGTLLFNGRAAETLSGKVANGRGIPKETCNAVPWWFKGELDSFELLELDPDGFISKGCGIAMGNIRAKPVKYIIDSFNAKKHPLFSTLLETGPYGLAKEAEEFGYTLKPDYADKCQLCQEARNVLRNKYPEYLVPIQHYR